MTEQATWTACSRSWDRHITRPYRLSTRRSGSLVGAKDADSISMIRWGGTKMASESDVFQLTMDADTMKKGERRDNIQV